MYAEYSVRSLSELEDAGAAALTSFDSSYINEQPLLDRERLANVSERIDRLEAAVRFVTFEDTDQHAPEDLRVMGVTHPNLRWHRAVGFIHKWCDERKLAARRLAIEILILTATDLEAKQRGEDFSPSKDDLDDAVLRVRTLASHAWGFEDRNV
jgi:hypothetical protein